VSSATSTTISATTSTASHPSDAADGTARREFSLGRPPMWLAVVITVCLITAMALVRLVLFRHRVVPVGYGVPLILFVWLRQRPLLWLSVAAFTAMSLVKFYFLLPSHAPQVADQSLRAYDFITIEVDLLVIAGIVHTLTLIRERIEDRNRELKHSNEQLEVINRELAAREEEVARQNEEMQSQTEELERQTEEMRVTNEELVRRERVTETLLSLSRSLTTELTRDEMMSRICDVLCRLIECSGTGAAILEHDAGRLVVRCHEGFGPAGLRESSLPMDRTFSALVISRGRTAYIEDLRQRPDLVTPQPKEGEPYQAILATPLRALGWPVGTLELYRRTPGPWTDDEVSVIESLAAQTSISLEALMHLHEVSQERRRFETVLRTAPVGIATCNNDCTDVRFNAAGAAMFGMPVDVNVLTDPTLMGATISREGRVIPYDQWPVIRAAVDGSELHGIDMEVVLASGRRISLLVNATPVRDAAGKAQGAVAAFVDITPLKELQRELDTRRRDAEEASVRKTRFLAAVSHDIRTPANAITLLAELIRRTASNSAMLHEIPELAREIHSSALSLVELLGDVLDLARYDSDRLEMQETEFSLAELLDEEHRRLLPLAREKGLTLNFHPPEPPVRLRTDRIKLSRVIGNLVGNAIKFTSNGEVSIEATLDGSLGINGAGGRAPVIRVRDTGIGIPREHQQNIFDEFVQLHNRERDRNKGTGLGLTICKRLVDAIGGKLMLDSEPGEGSTFTVVLPPDSVVR
jgi:PAS domain S-box-containing protein